MGVAVYIDSYYFKDANLKIILYGMFSLNKGKPSTLR